MQYKQARFWFSYIESLNISGVKIFHLPAHAIPAVFYLSVHAGRLLSFKTLQFPQQVFMQGLLLFFLKSQQEQNF